MRLLDKLQPIVLAFGLYMMTYLFLFQPSLIKGSSMSPNVTNNDRFISNKLLYRLESPKRYDVVVLHSPTEQGDFFKRVIGLPGETIRIQSGYVYINDSLLSEPYLPTGTATEAKSFLVEGVPYTIPQNYYIVLGDNRRYSSDSRYWGPVEEEMIIAKAWFRYWPLEHAGVVPRVDND